MGPDGNTTLQLSSGERIRATHAVGVLWVHPGPALSLLKMERDRCTVGRGSECDCRLAVHEVSRVHAEFVRRGPLWHIRDLRSTNGTHVDGERATDAALCPGQVIRLGGAVGIVVDLSASPTVDPSFGQWAPGVWGGFRVHELVEELRKIARSDLPVLLEGETGAGKEVFAQALHALSERPGALVPVNCAALPEGLAEGELFGYRRGAFTGADRNNLGYLRTASGGTLFLDEVVELPLPLQAKLLRALEAREVVPLGESTPASLDLRVVAAAQKPLDDCVDAGTFRRDLYGRLNGYRLRIPPLRDRREDILCLFRQFLAQHCGGRPPTFGARFAEALCLYSWPMNVRELLLLTRRLAVANGLESELNVRHLPEEITRPQPRSAQVNEPGEAPDKDHADLARLQAALQEHRGNVLRASAIIGISRQRAYRLLAMYEIDLEPYRRGQLR